MSEERKKLALDKIKMLEGKSPYNNMSNICWGDGIFASSIIRDFGQEADAGSISGVKAWAEGKPKEKPVRTYSEAEAHAMVAAALREAAGNFSEGWHDGISADCHTPNLRQMKDNILALIPTDHAAALDKLLAEAERRGMERAAQVVRRRSDAARKKQSEGCSGRWSVIIAHLNAAEDAILATLEQIGESHE